MRTAIFGGSFNPVHLGHVNLVRETAEKVQLDRVIVMPTFISPFKKDSSVFVADGANRLEMCRLAFEDMPFVSVSDYELSRQKVSYTVETMRHYKAELPDDELYFIMGSDMLLSLKKWNSFEEIMRLCTIIAASREENESDIDKLRKEAHDLEKYGRVIVVNISSFEVSSTEIREKIINNRDISCYVPKKVVKYILDINLYSQGYVK
ncbi:MAG: nicotinate (nicotinamide) nucleotide adenylyltransferase [Oscillospiraceae bacterium]